MHKKRADTPKSYGLLLHLRRQRESRRLRGVTMRTGWRRRGENYLEQR